MSDGGSSFAVLDGHHINNSERLTTHEEAYRKKTIQEWLSSLFMHSLNVGERLLENGELAMAATVFAHATLLTDGAELFVASVQQVYPCYFYRLYQRRMYDMGYNHLFPNTNAGTVRDHRSSFYPPSAQ